MKTSTKWIRFVGLILTVLVTTTQPQTMGGFPYKIRGPPRPPTLPNYMKKWHAHPFPGMRGAMFRPQMMALPTFPTFPAYKRPHPNALPYRPTKSQTALVPLIIPTWKTQSFNKGVAKKPSGSLFQSPAVSIPQFEFHSKPEKPKAPPTAAPLIKHVDDDKGPIHTIPAPNLSLADKPIVVEEMPQHSQQNIQLLQSQSYQIPDIAANGVYALGLHQYQVTEPTNDHSVIDVYTGQHKLVAPDPDPNLPAHKVPLSLDQHSTPSVNGKVVQPQPQDLTFGPGGDITNAELLQILNGYSQQQLVDSYGLPLAQQPQLQQHLLQQSQGIIPAINPTMQALQVNNGQLFLPDSNYMSQIQNAQANANYNQPQYQNFNYDEQTKQNSVIPDFNDASHSDKTIRNIPNYQLGIPNYQPAESALISNFVDHGNFIQNLPDPSLIYSQMTQKHEAQNHETQNVRFPNVYATLPSREVAETLASLQAAGQILSSPNQTPYHVATPMTIVVPDDSESFDQFEIQASGGNVKEDSDKEHNDDKKNYADVEYEDYEDSSKEVKVDDSEKDATFGTRIKPKS